MWCFLVCALYNVCGVSLFVLCTMYMVSKMSLLQVQSANSFIWTEVHLNRNNKFDKISEAMPGSFVCWSTDSHRFRCVKVAPLYETTQ